MNMNLRRACIADVPVIMDIISQAVERMLCEGKCQWDESYPAVDHIIGDIMSGVGYVMTLNGNVVAYGAVIMSGEPAYDNIDGDWLSDSRYVVLHRLAVAWNSQSRGIGSLFVKAVEHMAATIGIGSFKVDTNYDNYSMQRVLDKCGFAYCGTIHYEKGSRMAYEKLI